jgi:isopenicillin-N N-acyltransferase-like protein
VLVIEASGSPGDVGRMRGAAAADQVKAALELTCSFDLEGAPYAERLADVRQRLEVLMPHIVEEAAGLAAGAGITEDQALALSISIDLCNRLPGYCSLLALSDGDGVLLAKNQDTLAEMAPLQVVERIRPDEGLPYLNFTMTGAMWTDGGVNSAGLGLVCSSLQPAETNPDGLPDGIVIREVLRTCSSVDEASAYLASTRPMSLGENILVTDSKRRALRIESMPHGFATAEGLPMLVCNHPSDPRLAAQMDPDDPIAANSRRREALLTSGMPAPPGSDPADVALSLLESVLQTGDANLWTVASILVRPASMQLGSVEPQAMRDGSANAAIQWSELVPAR